MTGSADGFLWLAETIAYANLGVSIVLVLSRMIRGPSLPDRVVALDLIAILSAGLVSLYAIAAEVPTYLDVAITIALIAFLSTVAFARYVQQIGDRRGGNRK